ncbi:hypothetical protein PHLGIDRAFT_379139 [Phlebiopsis gigantea 11061_1 CR5-6]|uniref:F-box domain-containing protein n=1 Tax=Phlebiopsis gigantea (strain 11061_1 CR5-6) TaxID=745531 RepID=A0A0C3NTD3_PHLG1|nr:hypothetical protein PHLGIDRAFT_379139 [Phlebiopsis gigantea 11061_1 CR5-6]
MHPCFAMTDIQNIVFSMCADAQSRKSTLAALARTCSQFYGPAMDVLWYKIDGLGPLMHSMPSYLLCENIRPSGGAGFCEDIELHFAREPSQREWDAMFKHAHRVKDLSLGLSSPRWGKATAYSPTILPMILRQVQARLQGPSAAPIFPNLLILRCRWHPALDMLHNCMSRLVNWNMRSLRIYGSASQNSREFPSVNRFISTLTNSYPNVENFSVITGFAIQDVFARSSRELSDLAISLPRLRVFHSNIIVDKRALSHLCSMSNLTSLIVRIPEAHHIIPTVHTILHSLRTVNICAPDMDSCTTLLNTLRAPSLCTLDLQFSSPCTPSSVHRCFEAIQAYKSLRSLRLWADRIAWAYYQSCPCTVSPNTLRLLYELHELQSIRMEEHLKVDIHDEDALDMARAWPHMRRLVFTAFTGMDDEDDFPQLTAEALLHFTKYCPELRQLGLALDPSFDGMHTLEEPKLEHVGANLSVLEVHPPLAEVENPGEVAQFLHRVFPNLDSVRFGDTDLAMSHGWLLVSTALRSLSCGS